MARPGQLRAALNLSDRREVPEMDFYRVPLLQKLLGQRLQAHYMTNVEEDERLSFCLKSSKRLNKDIPLADSRLAPNWQPCIYSVMAGQNDLDNYKCTNVMIRDP